MSDKLNEPPESDGKDQQNQTFTQNPTKIDSKVNKKVKIVDHLDHSDEEDDNKPQINQIEIEKQKQKEERKKEREKKKDEDLLKKHNLEIEAKSKPSAKSKCSRWIKFNLKIGEGAYKYVYRGYDSFEGKNIAWCEFKSPHVDTKEKRTAMFKEFEIMLKMNHPHIVRGFDVFHEWTNVENPNNPFEVKGIVFIQELMEEGNVKSVIKKNFVDGQCILNSRLINRWWHQILDSLRYMHNKLQPPIVHRDLKGENCFLCSSSNEDYLSVKVGDFGLATKIKTSGPKTMIGTAGYMAPEIFDEKYNEKVDIYAFGMLMLEMITNKTPYEECDNIMAFAAKSMKGCGPNLIRDVNGKMEKEIIEACIHPNPCYRPSAEELYYHPFFQKYQESDSSWPKTLLVEVEPNYDKTRSDRYQEMKNFVSSLSNAENANPVFELRLIFKDKKILQILKLDDGESLVFDLDIYKPEDQDIPELINTLRNEYEKDLSTYFDHTGNKPADPKAVQSQLDKLFFSLQLQMQFLLKVLLGMRWRMILDDLVNEWNRSKPSSDLSDDNSDNGESVDNIAQIKIFKDFWRKTKKILDTEIANHRNKTCSSNTGGQSQSETKEAHLDGQQLVTLQNSVDSQELKISHNMITNISPIQLSDPPNQSNPANTPVGKPTSSDNSAVESGNPMPNHLPEVVPPIDIKFNMLTEVGPNPSSLPAYNPQTAQNYSNQTINPSTIQQTDMPGQIVYSNDGVYQNTQGTQQHQGQTQSQQSQSLILSNYQSLQSNTIINQEPIIQKNSSQDYNQGYYITKNELNSQGEWPQPQMSELDQNQVILQQVKPTHQISHPPNQKEENLKNNWKVNKSSAVYTVCSTGEPYPQKDHINILQESKSLENFPQNLIGIADGIMNARTYQMGDTKSDSFYSVIPSSSEYSFNLKSNCSSEASDVTMHESYVESNRGLSSNWNLLDTQEMSARPLQNHHPHHNNSTYIHKDHDSPSLLRKSLYKDNSNTVKVDLVNRKFSTEAPCDKIEILRSPYSISHFNEINYKFRKILRGSYIQSREPGDKTCSVQIAERFQNNSFSAKEGNELKHNINCYLCVVEIKKPESFSVNVKIEDTGIRNDMGNPNSVIFNLSGSFAQKFNLRNPEQLMLTSTQMEILQDVLSNALEAIFLDQSHIILGNWQFLCSLPSIDVGNRSQPGTIMQNQGQGHFYQTNNQPDTNESPEKYSSCQSNLSQIADGNNYILSSGNSVQNPQIINPHIIQVPSIMPQTPKSVLPDNGVQITGDDEEVYPESSQSVSPIDHTILLNSQPVQSSQKQQQQQQQQLNQTTGSSVGAGAANTIISYHNPLYQYSGGNPAGSESIANIHPGQEFYQQAQGNQQPQANMNQVNGNEKNKTITATYSSGIDEVEEIHPIGPNSYEMESSHSIINDTDTNRNVEIKLTISKCHEHLFQALANKISTNSVNATNINYLLNPQANQVQEICESESPTILVMSHGNNHSKLFTVPENHVAVVDRYGGHRFVQCNEPSVNFHEIKSSTTSNETTNGSTNLINQLITALQKLSNSPKKDGQGQAQHSSTLNSLIDRVNFNQQLDPQLMSQLNSVNTTPHHTQSLRNDKTKDFYLSLLNLINNPYQRNHQHTTYPAPQPQANELSSSNFNQTSHQSNNEMMILNQLLHQLLNSTENVKTTNPPPQANINQFLPLHTTHTANQSVNKGLYPNSNMEGEKSELNMLIQLLSNMSTGQNQSQNCQQTNANQAPPPNANTQPSIPNQTQQQAQQQILNQKSISSQSLSQNQLAELLQKSLAAPNFGSLQNAGQSQGLQASQPKQPPKGNTQNNLELVHANLNARFGPNYMLLFQQGLLNPALLQNLEFGLLTNSQSNQPSNLVNSAQLTHQNSNDSMAPNDVFQNQTLSNQQTQHNYHSNMLQDTISINTQNSQPNPAGQKSSIINQINPNLLQNTMPLNPMSGSSIPIQNEFIDQKSLNSESNYHNWLNNPNPWNAGAMQIPGVNYFPLQSNDEILNHNLFQRSLLHQNSFNMPMIPGQPNSSNPVTRTQINNINTTGGGSIIPSVSLANNFHGNLVNSGAFSQKPINTALQQQQQQFYINQHQLQSQNLHPTQIAPSKSEIDKNFESNSIQVQPSLSNDTTPTNNMQAQQFMNNLNQPQKQFTQNAPNIQSSVTQVQQQPTSKHQTSQQNFHQQINPVSSTSSNSSDKVKSKNIGRFHIEPASEEHC